MRFSILFLSFGLVLSHGIAEEEDPFEGKVEYAVNSGGMEMTYTVWMKGPNWRSELRGGNQLYELRMGDLEKGEAYLVNDGGKSYRPLGRGPGGQGGPGAGGPPRGGGAKKEKPLDLEKLVTTKEQSKEVLGYETTLEELRGPGKKLHFWWTNDLGDLSSWALPRLKALEGKERLIPEYLSSRTGGIPLVMEIPKSSGKNAFSMVATNVERMEIETDFLLLPDGYKPEMGTRPMGGGGRSGGGGGRGPGGGGRPRGPM